MGRVARRYPTKNGELDYVRDTPPHEQGLPHAVAFVVKRLFDNEPGPVLPVFQNTCYPPNQPTPRRCFAMGEAIAAAVAACNDPATVAIVASVASATSSSMRSSIGRCWTGWSARTPPRCVHFRAIASILPALKC